MFSGGRSSKIKGGTEFENTREGLLIRIKGSDYYVISDEDEFRCFLRGKFRVNGTGTLPVVGDRLVFRVNRWEDSQEKTGLILSIKDRKSIFARAVSGGRKKKVLGANLDYVFLIHAVRKPNLNTRLLDRMIVAAEQGGIEPVICINKLDLADRSTDLDRIKEIYSGIGYKFLLCSALHREGIEPLRSLMEGKISLMAGPSGAGKTTIISAIQPGLDIKIGKVSESTGKGKHTTSHLELHPLSGGGYMGDTPGIRSFGIELVKKNDLQDYFIEFSDYYNYCRFNTCVHHKEPGCAVKEAVESGEIASERYSSYIRMLGEIEEHESSRY